MPFLFFRIRDNGATVLRVSEDAHGRMAMDHIANANVKNGDIKPVGNAKLTGEENLEIATWIDKAQKQMADQQTAQMGKVCADINLLAHWIQTKATAEDVAPEADRLLISMHDLRQVLLRKIAEGGED